MYNELFEAWRKEKESAEIQPLQKGFYTRLAEYVKRIYEEKRMMDEKTVKGRLLKKEEENAKSMLEELIHTRYEKMTRIVTEGGIVPTTSLEEEEENLYKGATSQADSFQALIKDLLQGRLPKEKKVGPKVLMVVRILQEIPEIIGVDMKPYGPYKPEDIASLPKENARSLIKQGAAIEVETQ